MLASPARRDVSAAPASARVSSPVSNGSTLSLLCGDGGTRQREQQCRHRSVATRVSRGGERLVVGSEHTNI
jgi:hypothetical protein